MLASVLLSLAAVASAAPAAPAERQLQWEGFDPSWPAYRVSCWTQSRCPRSGTDGAAYSVDYHNLTTECTALPAGMHSCRLERFPIEDGVPSGNACNLNIYWRHRNGQCANKVMDLGPLTWEWSWNCGSVWGGTIQGYSVDCSQTADNSGANRVASGTRTGENAESQFGAGGVYE